MKGRGTPNSSSVHAELAAGGAGKQDALNPEDILTMVGQHPIRRLTAFSLLAIALFTAYVAYLWREEDSSWIWNWKESDVTIVSHALGLPISSADQWREFAVALSRPNSEQVLQLVPLLEHTSAPVRSAAARFLNSAPSMPSTQLPALISAHRRGADVLPAIARTGTTEAVDYIATECRQKERWGELASNLSSAGPVGQRRLASIYREQQPAPPELHRALRQICYQYSRTSPLDCGPWLDVARDTQSPETNRLAALELIALMDSDATGVLTTLKELAATGPSTVADAASGAVTQIEGKGTLAHLMPKLRFELSWKERPDLAVETVEQIGKLGTAGHAAAPLIVPLLSAPYWYPRAAAATALGRIGYTEAIPDLITALENQGDWVLSGAAAEALARLGAKEAIPALQQVATNHWYPPVRAIAAESVRVLSGQATFTDFHGPLAYFGWYGNIALDRHVWEFSQSQPKASTKLRFLRRLSCFVGNTWDRAWLWRARRVAKSADARLGRPDYGQAFGDGYLLGYHNGEWCGRLVYVVSNKVVRESPIENVFGFYPMPFGLVIVTSDFNSGEGMVYVLKRDAAGMPVCEPLQRLPFELRCGSHFAPVTRRWNRELLILGDANEAVVLTRSGTLRMAD